MTQVNPGAAVTGWRPVRRSDLVDLLAEIDRRLRRGTEIFLVGQTSQLYEGWIPEGHAAHLAAALPGRPALERAIGPAAPNGISVVLESPDEVIPLPEGHAGRARAVALAEAPDLRVSHFDPYSVAFRLIARGDEEDYRVVLRYLSHQWITREGMDAFLAGLLPRFTSETIQQDPAEFRRKYKGLIQMWMAAAAGTG